MQSICDNGLVFDLEVLDLKKDDLIEKFFVGIYTIRTLSLPIYYFTIAIVPHAIFFFVMLVSTSFVFSSILCMKVLYLHSILLSPN